MAIKDEIMKDLQTALKKGEKERLSVLRMLKSKILEKEVDLRSSKGRDYELTDEETLEVLSAYAKQRNQSIASYREGGRPELAAKEEMELAVVKEYLPEAPSTERLEEIVDEAIKESGAESMRDMGHVMRIAMSRLGPAADGKSVSRIVKEKLIARH